MTQKLTEDALRIPLERVVSQHLGRSWVVRTARDMADFASHPAAILSDGAYGVFAKFSAAANGQEQFEIELAGLRLLAHTGGALTPPPVGIIPAGSGSILVLEEVPSVERTDLHWRQIGQALARLHRIKGERYGLETNAYFGPLFQDNTPADSWAAFYAERRLLLGLKLAVDSGNLPQTVASKVERVITRLPRLCGDEAPPALLHGDAQQNNFISSKKGVYMIDPAAYFGNPEMDLAYIDYFQPVPQAVFDGYQELLPVNPGFTERRSLWRIWGYLAAVTVEGGGYVRLLDEAVGKYL